MATPFEDVYERAIFRFADAKFLQQDLEAREDILEKYLLSALTDFQHVSKVDISDYDLVTKQFNQTLGDDEIEILSLGLSFYWLSFKALDSELLKNVLNSKDYYYYSPGNLLKEVQTLRKTLYTEYWSAMRRYSFYGQDIGTVRA